MKRYALLSVTDKTGIVEFAEKLVSLGYVITSTGGTFRALRDGGIDVVAISDYTGFPEILEGRVKTLHGKVHGGILARRDDPGHQASMAEHGIEAIDVVAVNLYRFRQTAERPGVTDEEVIENIDIGGPAMIRSAAKNHAHVAVVVDPGDYDEVASALASGDAGQQQALRRRLAARAFAHTAAYDGAIAGWFAAGRGGEAELEDGVTLVGDKVQDLRYGENPHQQAAFYAVPGQAGPHLASAQQLSGKELSYNNLVDLDAALGLSVEFERPACVIVKHTNPCGASEAETTSVAFQAALASDPLSAFGGIIAFRGAVDAETAQTIVSADLFVEAVVAEEIAPEAVEILQSGRGGKGLRLLSLGGRAAPPQPFGFRPVHGGILVQSTDVPRVGEPPMEVVTDRGPDDGERAALGFAWKIAKHTKSNAIVLAAEADGSCSTVGVGAGQMSRVDSVKCSVEKAAERAAGSVLASDAFFPFADGVEAAAAAGVTAVIQPGGSRNDEEVIAAANKAGMAMVFTGMRHFRH